jgi:hypothetical protein
MDSTLIWGKWTNLVHFREKEICRKILHGCRIFLHKRFNSRSNRLPAPGGVGSRLPVPGDRLPVPSDRLPVPGERKRNAPARVGHGATHQVNPRARARRSITSSRPLHLAVQGKSLSITTRYSGRVK